MAAPSMTERWTERLRNVMPWGSSTCSKAVRLAPEEPGVIVRGKGCRVWDADGREFIDFRNGLGPVSLGYRFPAVDEAIRRQLEQGIVYGHPHPLECEVAEMLCECIPCAEQSRFLKTGGEAVAACIRLARHHTGREHVIQIGYNGWLNGLAARGTVLPGQSSDSTPPGVPRCLSALHHACTWNDIAALEEIFAALDGRVAALVVAADYPNMAAGSKFYPAVRTLTEKHGTVLIFDEIVTGFRLALGGAQEYFGITPDLAVFAKGFANGMPISAYVGKRGIMKGLEKVIVSSTYGGETLSLAAAKAAINTFRTQDVCGHIWKQGERIWGTLNQLFKRHRVPAEMKGLWPCPRLAFEGEGAGDISGRFFRNAYRNGVSLYSTSYVNFSHRDADIDEAIERLDKAVQETARG